MAKLPPSVYSSQQISYFVSMLLLVKVVSTHGTFQLLLGKVLINRCIHIYFEGDISV